MCYRARLTGDFKRNLREAELNFPAADYTSQELPVTIAQLADYIKEEQVTSKLHLLCLAVVSFACWVFHV